MNKSQREYACNRVWGTAAELKKKLKDSLTTGDKLTDQDRARLLRLGKVKLKKGVKSITRYTDVVNVFDFAPFDQKVDKSYERRAARIDAEATKVCDQIMLGDATEAAKLVDEYCGGGS